MIYTIPKNSHYSGFRIGFTSKRYVKFIAYFHINCLYHFGDIDDWDINKLFGIVPFWKHHHKQSARIGWRCIDRENIQLLTYCYSEGKRLEPILITKVQPYQDFTCKISDKGHIYEIEVELEGKRIIKTISKTKDKCSWHRYLWPYFGGNKTAPHKMAIDLKKIS